MLGLEEYPDSEDGSLDPDTGTVSSIFILIPVISLSLVILSVLIVTFIKHKAFFLPRSKGEVKSIKTVICYVDTYYLYCNTQCMLHADESVGLSHSGPAGRGRGRGGHSDTSRFVVNISGGAGDGARSTVVEMADNQHQVAVGPGTLCH